MASDICLIDLFRAKAILNATSLSIHVLAAISASLKMLFNLNGIRLQTIRAGHLQVEAPSALLHIGS